MRKLTIAFVAALLVAATCLPAVAQDKTDFAFYGTVRFWTAWEKDSLGTLNLGAAGGAAGRSAPWRSGSGNGAQEWDDADLYWGMGGSGRFGFRAKAGQLGGQFEVGYGVTEGSATPSAAPGAAATQTDEFFVRIAAAYWDFGAGRLRIGQDYTPLFFLISDMCGPGAGECSGIGYGSVYDGRRDYIGLTFGGFQFALVEPSTTLPNNFPSAFGAAALCTASDTDRTLPKISASYTGSFGPITFYVGGSYNKMTGEYVWAGGIERLVVDSWVGALGMKANFGPFYVNGILSMAQNPGNLGYATAGSMGGNVAWLNNNAMSKSIGIIDSDYWCGFITAGFKVSDMMKFEVGYSHQEFELDDIVGSSRQFEYDTQMYYLLAVISPVKNFYIIPEIGKIEYNHRKWTNNPDMVLGDTMWAGIKWQIDF